MGGLDAFLTVFSPAGDSLVYSTYLGGPGDDYPNAIALDASANAYITGEARAGGFPTLHSVKADGNVFVAKFNSAGVLQYSSVFGVGTYPHAIAVDASGSAYITGEVFSNSYPTVRPAYQYTCGAIPNSCSFVTKLSPSGERLVYSTYLGGTRNEPRPWDCRRHVGAGIHRGRNSRRISGYRICLPEEFRGRRHAMAMSRS